MLSGSLMADQVPWMTDLDEAFEVAKQENRPLLVHFWSPDCIPCLQLEETVFNKPSVTRTLGELFVPVKINAKEHPRIAARYEIRSVPWDVILTPGGDELHRMLSPQDPKRYVAQLSAAAFRMNAAIPRRDPSGPDRSAPPPTSSVSYDSPLGPPPGGSPWQPASTKLPDDGIGPIGADSAPRRDRRVAEPAGQPEEVINRYAQSNSPATRPARQAVVEDRPQNAGNQWGQWPGRSPASRPSVNHSAVRPDRRSTERPVEAKSTSLETNDRVAMRSEPAPPQRRPQPNRPARRPGNPVGLDGFCPVTLLKKDIWKKGDGRFGVVHRGRTYLFTGAEEKDEFLKDPDAYSPVLAGIDPVLLADSGEAVEGLRAYGLFYRKRVFLFTTEENLQRFWQQPEQYAAPVRQAMENGTVDRLFR